MIFIWIFANVSGKNVFQTIILYIFFMFRMWRSALRVSIVLIIIHVLLNLIAI